jgi:hypothetical protein
MYLSENDVRIAQQRHAEYIRSARAAYQVRLAERVPSATQHPVHRLARLARAWFALVPGRAARAWR